MAVYTIYEAMDTCAKMTNNSNELENKSFFIQRATSQGHTKDNIMGEGVYGIYPVNAELLE